MRRRPERRASSPSCRAGRGPRSSPRPGSTTSGSTGRRTGAIRLTVDELADLFVADIDEGIDEHDYGGPSRPPDGTSAPGSSRSRAARAARPPRDRRIFVAAAAAHRTDRRPDPHALRGRHRRARADPRCLTDLRRGGRAHLAQPCRQGGRPRLPPRARSRPARSPSTTRRSAGATRGTARSGCSTLDGRGRQLIDQSCSGWTPHGSGYYRSFGGSPGLAVAARRLQRPRWRRAASAAIVRQRIVRGESGPGVRIRGGRSMSREPLLTSVVGSHARPSWFVAGIAAAERGEFGPADLAEMLDDAVDLALRDQEEAGHRHRQRRRDATGRLLHRGVLRAPDRRAGAPARSAAGGGRARPAASIRGRRADRRARRPGRRRGVHLRLASARPARSR